MNKNLRRALFSVSIAVVGALVVLFCFIAFHRYPTQDEIIERFSASASVDRVTIDSTQGDIGYFGLTAEGAEGIQEFFIETFPQWVFPWDSYDWSEAGF
jgi:hypothetical protein